MLAKRHIKLHVTPSLPAAVHIIHKSSSESLGLSLKIYLFPPKGAFIVIM